MREKFGLIIHWIGFVLGIILSGGAVIFLYGFATKTLLLFLIVVLFFIPLLLIFWKFGDSESS